MKINFSVIIEENKRRLNEMNSPYNPVVGIGSPVKRIELIVTDFPSLSHIFLPEDMFSDAIVWELFSIGSYEDFKKKYPVSREQLFEYINKIRCLYDFEYWAYMCAKIKDKESGHDVPFKLNRPQRRLLFRLEKMRLAGKPIRAIILKARQWGGSTLIQIYAQWIQVVHKQNWNSVIIGDVESQSRNIRAMYRNVAKYYPSEIGSITLKAFEGSGKNIYVEETGSVISIGSMQKPDSLRSSDIKIAHFSEVGLWKATEGKKPEDLIQSVKSSIPYLPYTLVAEESTAKGRNNYFHRSWVAAETGKSGYDPVFIPWYSIERYQMEIIHYERFISEMDDYDWFLWDEGATLEGIRWYKHHLAMEMLGDTWRMKSEFPTTAEEAFENTGRRVFSPKYTANIKKTCKAPSFIGEIHGAAHYGEDALKDLHLEKADKGNLFIWAFPDKETAVSDRYAAFADIGGRTHDADWSVIRVVDRYWLTEGGKPEIVATWRGHLDQDLFAWKCAQLAAFYNNALLAVESNSLRKEGGDGDHFLTILDEIVDYYDNLYRRQVMDTAKNQMTEKIGFHTNKSTKPLIINHLNKSAREELYIERDIRAYEEMSSYEVKSDGSYGAPDGGNDDIVIATAGVVWLALSHMPMPRILSMEKKRRVFKNSSYANI